MWFQISSLLVCACVVSAAPQGHQQQQQQQQHNRTASSKEQDLVDYNSLGQYENIATATVEILPVLSNLFDHLTPDAAAIRSGDPFDSERLKSIVLAFIPVTRQVLIATARSEGRSVRQDVLDRLDAMEKTLPSAFDFMANVRRTDFYGIGEDYSYYYNRKIPEWQKNQENQERQHPPQPVEYNPEKFSGSIVNMPNQRTFFINHPPKTLWENN